MFKPNCTRASSKCRENWISEDFLFTFIHVSHLLCAWSFVKCRHRNRTKYEEWGIIRPGVSGACVHWICVARIVIVIYTANSMVHAAWLFSAVPKSNVDNNTTKSMRFLSIILYSIYIDVVVSYSQLIASHCIFSLFLVHRLHKNGSSHNDQDASSYNIAFGTTTDSQSMGTQCAALGHCSTGNDFSNKHTHVWMQWINYAVVARFLFLSSTPVPMNSPNYE